MSSLLNLFRILCVAVVTLGGWGAMARLPLPPASNT